MEEEERPTKKARLDANGSEGTPQDVNGRSENVSQETSSAPEAATDEGIANATSAEEQTTQPMSKNAMKKLLRRQRHEATREQFKAMKREKKKARIQRRKAEAVLNGIRFEGEAAARRLAIKEKKHYKVPVTIIIDCGFDDKMLEKEISSLGSQLTRCYSDNRAAAYQPQLMITDFGGNLQQRFDGPLGGQHKAWTGLDFVSQSLDSDEAKQSTVGWNERCAEIRKMLESNDTTCDYGALPPPSSESSAPEQEIVYLTSDSPHTLTSLSPHTSYIIGGLVDKNRYKGICYKKAMDLKLKTAQLPIGEFMEMSSRKVLTVNHVFEIMLKWIEHGDWAKAFISVIPQRKGGVLKEADGANGEDASEGNGTGNDTALGADDSGEDEQDAAEAEIT